MQNILFLFLNMKKSTKNNLLLPVGVAVLFTAVVLTTAFSVWYNHETRERTTKMPENKNVVQVDDEDLIGAGATVSELPFTYNGKQITLSYQSVPVSRIFSTADLVAMSEECGTNKNESYFKTLLNKFSPKDEATTFEFFKKGEINGESWKATVIPNKPQYKTLAAFKKDFDTCAAGGKYPVQISSQSLLFVENCGETMDKKNNKATCDDIRKIVEPSLKLR